MVRFVYKIFLPLIFLFFCELSYSQNMLVKKEEQHNPANKYLREIKWNKSASLSCFKCSNILWNNGEGYVPLYNEKFIFSGKKISRASVKIIASEPISEAENKKGLPQYSGVKIVDIQEKGKTGTLLSFYPFVRENGKVKKIVKFEWIFEFQGLSPVRKAPSNFAGQSVLANGIFYKIAVTQDGVYKISYQWLKDRGIDPRYINPKNIKIYGNGGAMLPFDNNSPRIDDLAENAIYVEGEADGVFNVSDYILFYGQAPHMKKLSTDKFYHETNIFSDTTYYFLTFDTGPGKRIAAQNDVGGGTVLNTFNDFQFYEKEQYNILKSGRQWFGENFGAINEYSFSFNFPNIDYTTPVSVKTRVAARSINTSSSFTISAGNVSDNITVPYVTSNYVAQYAASGTSEFSFVPTTSSFKVKVTFNPANSSASGWLDYIELNAKRQLIMYGEQMHFRDVDHIDNNIYRFQISNVSPGVRIWEITDITDVKEQLYEYQNSTASFSFQNNQWREFVVFNNNNFYEPVLVKKVANQNLHADSNIDLVIVTHPKFYEQAAELADFHEAEDGLSTKVVTVEQLYNEFSSGKQDITAIKDYLRMLYERANGDSTKMPKYLLLFGDASYDYKYRISGNSNYVPTYQSYDSFTPTSSYVSDDYFGLLDTNEGDALSDVVDIGIGRIPVRSKQEAQQMVSKIKHYYDPSTMKPWRTKLTFIADDEDNNIHMIQANTIADSADTWYSKYNVQKIYLDAYQQVTTAGGERYPDVNQAIDREMEKGTLILTWVGHGGVLGWAQERILQISQIKSWNNFDNMPLFLTATCEFTRFDDPTQTSAGEYVFLNSSGGGIGLLTTTRVVYSSPNFELVQTFFENVMTNINNQSPTLGDLVRLTKANGNLFGQSGINYRNFTLIGDPALRLAYPQYQVISTQTMVPDTMRALSKVTISGFVADENGNKINNFNGYVYPVVYDKYSTIKTLNNDNTGEYTFKVQKNALFKGKASVKNGEFQFTFVVSKDIDYAFGKGKISCYAENGEVDAAGNYEDFIIGGTNPDAPEDNTGPRIDLYMNDEDFVFGGITDENPQIYAVLFDENGINTTGSGIGHEITAVLDKQTSNPLILNDYYEADLDSYKSGKIRYPFYNLTEGTHSLELKAWDVYNNSGTGYTEFVVANSAEIALDHVLNYPNPFSTHTEFFMEHNRPGSALRVRIQIFTVSGKIIKTIDHYEYSTGYRIGPISWNGTDEFGDKIGSGVYIYRVTLKTESGETIDKYEKLVILN
ncbi:MAG: oxidoreductase [Bacteroidetes bacterium]|nr:MAG: oxidoreductase [Bacteroidota bacterium]